MRKCAVAHSRAARAIAASQWGEPRALPHPVLFPELEDIVVGRGFAGAARALRTHEVSHQLVRRACTGNMGKGLRAGAHVAGSLNQLVTSPRLRFVCHDVPQHALPHPRCPTPLAASRSGFPAGSTSRMLNKSDPVQKEFFFCSWAGESSALVTSMSIVERLSRSIGGNVTDTGI